MISLNVARGPGRKLVGTISPQIGLATSAGRITRVTDTSIWLRGEADGPERRLRNTEAVTVRYSDAVRYGFTPSKANCLTPA
jgi:hypothetical protein